MARERREWIDGAIYHVFSRGSNRQAIFLNDGDYVEFDVLLADRTTHPRARRVRLVAHAEPLARGRPVASRRSLGVHEEREPPLRSSVRSAVGSNGTRLREPLRSRPAGDAGAAPLDSPVRGSEPGRGRSLRVSLRRQVDELPCNGGARAGTRVSSEGTRYSRCSAAHARSRIDDTSTS